MVGHSLQTVATMMLGIAIATVAGKAGRADAQRCGCPEGFVLYWPDEIGIIGMSPMCYKFVRDLASWAEAKVYCGVMGASMVEVPNVEVNKWIEYQLCKRDKEFKHHLLEKAQYWLGATDLQEEKMWKWDSSNTDVFPTFWLSNEPNNYLDYQNCLATRRRCSDYDDHCRYGWFDDDCYQKKFYICQVRCPKA